MSQLCKSALDAIKEKPAGAEAPAGLWKSLSRGLAQQRSYTLHRWVHSDSAVGEICSPGRCARIGERHETCEPRGYRVRVVAGVEVADDRMRCPSTTVSFGIRLQP